MAGSKIDLTRSHENEKSERYILLAFTPISHPQNVSNHSDYNCAHSAKLKFEAGSEVHIWCPEVPFLFFAKNRWGGGRICPSPVRVLIISKSMNIYFFSEANLRENALLPGIQSSLQKLVCVCGPSNGTDKFATHPQTSHYIKVHLSHAE